MQNTLIVWRRTGKEHGEDTGFQLNSPELVDASLREKVDLLRSPSPDQDWSWWQLGDGLLVEKNLPGGDPQVLYYHIPQWRCMIVENATIPRMGPDWPWYIHIGDHEWRADLECWVFTDHFIDIFVHHDGRTHVMVDLDDLASAIDIGIVSADRASGILRDAQNVSDSIRDGDFPPSEILPIRDILRQWGLVP